MSPRSDAVRTLWRTRPRSRALHWSVAALTLIAAGSWLSGEIRFAELFSARRRANLERFLERDALPYPLQESGWSWNGFLDWAGALVSDHGWSATLTTLEISVLAIALAGIAAALTAPLAARTLMTRDPYLVGNRGGQVGLGWRALTAVTRLALILLRAVPEYVWAFLLLAMLGASAWPAVLALAIHNAGILGRLGADTIENLDAAPLRSLRMLGASRRQLAVTAVLPLSLQRLLLYFFYRFETCVREATVLGMLGVVSLGYWIQDSRARQTYDEMLVFVALGGLLVLAADAVSVGARAWLRRAR